MKLCISFTVQNTNKDINIMKNATTHNFKKLSKDEQRKRMRKTVRLVEHKTEDIPKLEKNVANMTKAQMLDYIKIIKAEFVRRGYTK